MELKRTYKDVVQQTLGVMGSFCLFSLIFVGAYLYVDHDRYLSAYQTQQKSELKSAQEKIQLNIENLKKLSTLTSKRIEASSGNIQRIQNILQSSPFLLPDKDFLKIQKMTYEKLSKPKHLITRFGLAPLDSNKSSLDRPHKIDPSVFFDQGSVHAETWILDQNGQLDGILEIHVALSHFKETLKIAPTLSFAPGSAHTFLQKNPLPLYGKPPEKFWGYLDNNVGHYTVFFLFMNFSLIFIVISIYCSRFRIKQTFQEEIEGICRIC